MLVSPYREQPGKCCCRGAGGLSGAFYSRIELYDRGSSYKRHFIRAPVDLLFKGGFKNNFLFLSFYFLLYDIDNDEVKIQREISVLYVRVMRHSRGKCNRRSFRMEKRGSKMNC